MSITVKLDVGSICPGCDETPPNDQCVQCYVCKSRFHAVCEVANDTQVGTKTMVKTFVATSTKSNFKFFCDVCVTVFERNLVETEDQKINALFEKVVRMENKLNEITDFMKASTTKQNTESTKPAVANYWDNKEGNEIVKAPPQQSTLILKSYASATQNNEIQDKVQQTIVDNNIPVTKSFTNKTGDTVMICETKEDRDKLKNLVSRADEEIVMTAPGEIRHSITIVGFRREYEKDEIIRMLELQNGFIKNFANSNDINDHIEIFSVRPLKNNTNSFQAFASVSATLREGFTYYKNKVTIGLASCKIYDRYHVKRCNVCQHFGHYARDCPTPDEHACAKCSGNHKTDECVSETPKCVNCVRSDNENTQHHAYSHTCPAMKTQQESLKKKLENHLNSKSRNRPLQR